MRIRLFLFLIILSFMSGILFQWLLFQEEPYSNGSSHSNLTHYNDHKTTDYNKALIDHSKNDKMICANEVIELELSTGDDISAKELILSELDLMFSDQMISHLNIIRSIVSKPEGAIALLDILYSEPSGPKLKTLLLRLLDEGCGGTVASIQHISEILGNREFIDNIWDLFEDEQNQYKKNDLLGFFIMNTGLRNSKVSEFVNLAKNSNDLIIYSSVLNVLRGMNQREDIREVLCMIACNNDDPIRRTLALDSLKGCTDSVSIDAMIHSLKSSNEEVKRSALMAIPLSNTLIDNSEIVEYINDEIRIAASPRFKIALVNKLIELEPSKAINMLEELLAIEANPYAHTYYSELIKLLKNDITDLPTIYNATNLYRNKYEMSQTSDG